MNQSKKNDKRFWRKWLANGSVRKRKINLRTPFYVDAISINHLTGWNTISCLKPDGKYAYFVTRKNLELHSTQFKFPNDALSFEQGMHLVELVL